MLWLVYLFGASPEQGNITAKVVAIYSKKAFVQSTEEIPEDSTFGLLLDRTSFYAESGGQEYDTGSIIIDGVAEFEVTNVQVYNGYVLHIGHIKYGKLQVGDEIVSSYDEVCLLKLHARLLRFITGYSFAAGHSATTTPPRTSSITPYVRSLAITSTRRALPSHLPSSVSTSRTKPRCHLPS